MRKRVDERMERGTVLNLRNRPSETEIPAATKFPDSLRRDRGILIRRVGIFRRHPLGFRPCRFYGGPGIVRRSIAVLCGLWPSSHRITDPFSWKQEATKLRAKLSRCSARSSTPSFRATACPTFWMPSASTRRTGATWSWRCSSTLASGVCGPSRWTRPTACSAARPSQRRTSPSACPSGKRFGDASSTSSASRSTACRSRTSTSAGPSTRPPPTTTS